jgi:hypothetical protein
MKLTKRKAFNFFRSYYDVYNELSDKDKVLFMDALLDRQFLGVKPDGLTGIVKFAYISQTHSIDSQIKGYETKTGEKLDSREIEGATVGATVGATNTPSVQVQEKGEGQEKEKGKYINTIQSRKLTFSQSTSKLFDSEFPNDKHHLDDFVEYWTEHGDRDKKMRFEKQKSFSTSRRVKTWIKNNFNNNRNGKQKEIKQSLVQIALNAPKGF